eukprot:jgi/Bigna1/64521/fgenesh1_kg.78_\
MSGGAKRSRPNPSCSLEWYVPNLIGERETLKKGERASSKEDGGGISHVVSPSKTRCWNGLCEGKFSFVLLTS